MLGQTDYFSLSQLLDFQKQSGDDLKAGKRSCPVNIINANRTLLVVDLTVTFNPNPTRVQASAKTPKSPKATTYRRHSRSLSSPTIFSQPSTPVTPSSPVFPSISLKTTGTLRLSIRETAVADYNTRATAALIEAFAEQNRRESLKDLAQTIEILMGLRAACAETKVRFLSCLSSYRMWY